MNQMLPVQKLDKLFNLSILQTECAILIDKIGLEPSNNQLCLMHSNSCSNLWHDGVGSLRYKSPGIHEANYSIINQSLENWYIGDVLRDLVTQYKISRARLMAMKPRHCYSWHRDSYNRLHIAIETNENCRMVFENGCFHIPADGFLYLTKTTEYHSAFNGDNKLSRLHIVCNKDVKL